MIQHRIKDGLRKLGSFAARVIDDSVDISLPKGGKPLYEAFSLQRRYWSIAQKANEGQHSIFQTKESLKVHVH